MHPIRLATYLRLRAGLLLVLLPGMPAFAQEPSGDASELLVPPPAPPVVPWSVDHQWRTAGLRQPVVDVTITPMGTRLALGARGEVQRSVDGGPWQRVLAPIDAADGDRLSDEDVLLEAEATFDELIRTNTSDDAEGEEDTFSGESVDETDEVAAQALEVPELDLDLSQEIDIAIFEVEEGLRADGGPAGSGRLWSSQDREGLVLAGRADGLWRSDDDGRTWSRVDQRPAASAYIERADGQIVVGGPWGLLLSADDGRTFRDDLVGLGGVEVSDLDSVGDALLASTEQGLLLSIDGRRWSPIAGAVGPVRGALIDPTWEGGFWFWTAQALYRSDDLGQTSRLAGRNPMAGTNAVTRVATTGHLILAGDDGPWESVDGGVTWRPLSSGLADPQVLALASWMDVVLLAGPRGAQLLGRTPIAGGKDPSPTASPLPKPRKDPPLREVVGRALERPGLDLDDMTLGNSALLSQLIPRFVVEFGVDVDRYRDTVYDSLRTSEGVDPSFHLTTSLCWGACSGTYASYDVTDDPYDAAVESSEQAVENLMVVDGEVYDLSDGGALPSAAANLAHRATGHRTEVARTVTAAWGTRQGLLAETQQVASMPLSEQLVHLLLLQELDARLDAYTDGWFTRTRDSAEDSPDTAP